MRQDTKYGLVPGRPGSMDGFFTRDPLQLQMTTMAFPVSKTTSMFQLSTRYSTPKRRGALLPKPSASIDLGRQPATPLSSPLPKGLIVDPGNQDNSPSMQRDLANRT
jgi:hypothetical protein